MKEKLIVAYTPGLNNQFIEEHIEVEVDDDTDDDTLVRSWEKNHALKPAIKKITVYSSLNEKKEQIDIFKKDCLEGKG